MKKGLFLLIMGAVILLSGCNSTPAPSVSVYNNPIAEQRADPWVYKDDDGTYYFIATAPEFDYIELRAAKTINGLNGAVTKRIWIKHAKGPMSEHIWAPELHKIDGKWVVYFAASSVEDKWHIDIYALSNPSADPMLGEWKEEGRIDTGWDNFALDATTFVHNNQRYMIWAQADPDWKLGSVVWMAPMTSATTIDTEKVMMLTKPEYDWETVTYRVNEGPAVLKRNGMVFVTYSASATDDNYAMGMMWADENSDLMDPASWHKSSHPVFSTNAELNRYGPGHNSFTVAEDGTTDLLIYHARDYLELQGDPLSDPNRHTRVRVIQYDDNGFPDFGQDIDD